jgi:hypothetical protein
LATVPFHVASDRRVTRKLKLSLLVRLVAGLTDGWPPTDAAPSEIGVPSVDLIL